MTNIPEGLPTLSTGAHKPGDGKACVMEYVALLAGESWTDNPACTHPLLAEAARKTNDALSNTDRHLMVPLIGRLFGTTETGSPLERKRLNVGLALWCADQVAHLVRPQDRAACEGARTAARAWLENPSEENAAYAAAYAAAAYASDAAAYAAYAAYAANAAAYAVAQLKMLNGLLDEYDRLTGRTERREVSTNELTDLRDRVTSLVVA